MINLTRSCFFAWLVLLFLATGALAADDLFLWRMSDGQRTFALFGSLHMLPDTSYLQNPGLQNDLRTSDRVVLEFDLAEADQPEAAQMVARHALLKHSSLPELVPDRLWQKIKKAGDDSDIDPQMLQHYQPWFAAVQIANAGLIKLGFDPANGADTRIYQQAVTAGKTVVGLETMLEQLEMFAGMETDVQISLLMQTIEDLEIIEQQLGDLYTAWKGKNQEQLEEVLLKSFRNHPDIYRRLLAERNRRWMRTLLAFPPGHYLVVVGAGHLIGDEGLLRLFQKHGFRSIGTKQP